jgi:hypothetical protein
MMSLTFTRTSYHRFLTFALITGVVMLALFTGIGRASADSTSTTATLSDSLMLSGSGFTPNEKIDLWTTDPKGKAVGAGYIFADNSGKFSLQIDANDPNGVALTSDYTTLTDNYDADGNFISEYWETTLMDGSPAGDWHITAHGDSSNILKVSEFMLVRG